MALLLICLLSIIAWGWGDLVDWLGFWWALGLSYTVVCFPIACLAGRFIRGSEVEQK